MAAKTGELTAYGARKREPPKRLWGLGSSDGSVRCDVSNCGIGNNGLWHQLGERAWDRISGQRGTSFGK